MKQYCIGTKIVLGLVMTRAEFLRYIDRAIDPNTSGADDGYMVEYTDGGAPNHPDHAGFISWCPKAQFESQNLAIGDIGHLLPHQQRVIAELEQLDDRIQKLELFLRTELFAGLPEDEQQLLKMQADAMVLYLGILNTRAAKFA